MNPQAKKAAEELWELFHYSEWRKEKWYNFSSSRQIKEEQDQIVAIIERNMTQEWVKCSERMPIDRQSVVTRYAGIATPIGAYWDGERFLTEDQYYSVHQDLFISWLPLPPED